MAHADMDLDQALEVAHLPAPLAAMVHMTGDAGWLKPEWTPTYTPLSRGDPGLSKAVHANKGWTWGSPNVTSWAFQKAKQFSGLSGANDGT
jgi:hypothetical protein